MVNEAIIKAFSAMFADEERMKCPVSKALILSLEEYVNLGYKLSELSWFRGLNFEVLEKDLRKVA
ncbi:MAG: hypothetical protein LBO62_07805 [Endomicrobium sp.]|jgi:hypothetical protein|nr:hypothetical protein [Endomicrobium sp.]